MRHHRIKSMTCVICGMKAQVAKVRGDDAEGVRKGLSPSCHLQASEDPGKRGSVPFFPASEGPGKRGSVPFLPS